MSNAPAPVRWGIVGLGWAAADFVAPAMVKSAGSQLAACLGSSLAKGRAFAERFGVERVHDDLEGLMHDPGVDAVYIALPNALHHMAVLAAARGQKHVLCEKPFAMSVAHARDMVAACREAGVLLRIAHQIRLDVAVGQAREIVRSGRLGRLAAIPLPLRGQRAPSLTGALPSNAPPACPRARRGARTPRKAASSSTWGCICST